MMLHIPGVLGPERLQAIQAHLQQADWEDGLATVGALGATVKRNRQLPRQSPLAQALAHEIAQTVRSNPQFVSFALPLHILPPLFNRYEGGENYGLHVDGSIRQLPDGSAMRTDVSSTLFLSDPDSYEGGELVVVDTYGTHEVKLPAGDMIVYPATSLHQVLPVTRGARLASFFWTQSLIRDDMRRGMLYELDQTIQRLLTQLGSTEDTVALTNHYHNLLRQWAQT
ncbi:Fe2+-dependent dioxygenase [Allofranklinella schreckenbergeri]|uniref:Fe2+-dependent dioxygenase n=1 Tax=Allofranklinella schreckenbergeri TaxID=1076744 RepID=A0A3M6R7C0_9BURK|nr:Fe2+-dependent dioxygenase [Allofranklinella schreckenbergeri]MDO4705788.1 Fe2+-dependent dioxygenase [Comamonadaceae bacterium]RMX11251.1 Fe2+-dependent dioxygenase [Allofranklinella schreckenbergeri]